MNARLFLSRRDATLRHALMDAAQIERWRVRGWPLPNGVKVACRIGTEVYEAKGGERLHSDIRLRAALWSDLSRVLGGLDDCQIQPWPEEHEVTVLRPQHDYLWRRYRDWMRKHT